MQNAIALLDCNNFYASCERVFDASVKRKPIVVLSNNDGCVIARSEEAKEIGVTMGAPLFKVESLLTDHDAEIYSSNYALYGDMSSRVMNLLHNFTPEVEIYSIDEAFLNLEPRKHSLDNLAHSIREKMYQWTGIPVSIGIAETKVLAKIANRRAKKDELREQGVLNLYRSSKTESILKETLVQDVWGIGYRSSLKLKASNILTAWQLRETDNRFIRRLLTVTGARIALELRGIKCLPLEQSSMKKHSITCSRSFGQIITNYELLKEATLYFLTRVCEKMRHHNLAANAVTVFISTDRFRPVPVPYSPSATYSATYPTDSNQELQEWTFSTLERIYDKDYEYRKAGIILSGLVPSEELTKRMFDDERFERQHKLMKAVDAINQKFGKDTVRFASVKTEGRWKMKQTRKSQSYTTNWNELLIVN
ncbi:MAG: Y-family DNA polymerase [Pyrinomonadaceae bacterium]|nr:Y-family DNA polymerase [Pyrinomonadaceae bacterium]